VPESSGSDPIARVLEAFASETKEGVSSRSEFERLKGRYLGREKGLVTALFAGIRDVPPAERGAFGSRANAAKKQIEETVARLGAELDRREAESRRAARVVDVTLPGRRARTGGLHPITIVRRRIEEIFLRMGYSIADGPELENDRHNFELLNFPPNHPARDSQDSFFIDRKARSPLLLRTHTSPVQIRELQRRGAPLRVIAPGRVYRNESVDATHAAVFHQVEGLVVERGISMADLKGTIQEFFGALFGPETRARFIPTFFPFVEPGADVAASCIFCKGRGCARCKHSGWIELAGSGAVHPKVLEACGVDPEIYTGFAFGLGLDRVAMLLYEFPDLRLLLDGDERFLEQFAGSGA
jgi:phenylalanyl-tRNA synthetase alpha chain